MASSTKFLDEVCEQFLTCKVCCKTFKDPKALNCLHTFCCECLEKCYESEEQQRRPYRFLLYARAISCPVCNVKTDIPTGGISRLPDNSFLYELCQMVNRSSAQDTNVKLCEICTSGKTNDGDSHPNFATTKCMECSKFLCQVCTNRHKNTKVTQLHSLFKLDIEKDIQCKVHTGEMIKYFCGTCDECICVLCAFQSHKNHEVSSVAEVVEDGKNSLHDALEECTLLIEKLNAQIEGISNYQVHIKETEDKIRECATEMVTLIRQKERDLLSLLKQSTDPKIVGNISDKEKLENIVHKLEVVSKQATSIMNENNIEVILAKKLLKEQLTFVTVNTNISVPHLPSKPNTGIEYFQRLRKLLNENEHRCLFQDKSMQTDDVKTSNEPIKVLPEVSNEKSAKVTQWQKPLPLVEVIQNTIVNPVVLLKKVHKEAVKTKDSCTEMTRIVLANKSIGTTRVLQSDKETSTFQAKVMHKNVSTISQVTSDKSTSTSDVSAIQRTVANTKRQITVSRGTMTSFQMLEKAVAIPDSDTPNKIFHQGQNQPSPNLTFVSQIDVSSNAV